MRKVVLRTLGTVELTNEEGRSLESILQQPKRFALLAYLAVSTPSGFRRREALMALLWPELDEEHARAALRKALFTLRQELGEHAIVGRGDDEIRVAHDVVWCDAVAFGDALRSGHLEEALAHYRGDLLPGFHVTDASAELSHWLDDERTNLRGQAAGAAWRLAEQREHERDVLGAREWVLRAAQLEPFDESACRRLIATLDRLGDRSAAIRAYEAFKSRLWDQLELAPSPETVALVQSLRARPAVQRNNRPAIIDVIPAALVQQPANRTATSTTLPSEDTLAASRRSSRRSIRRRAVLWSGIAMAGALAVVLPWLNQTPPSPRPRAVVRPFQNASGESVLDAIGVSVARAVVNALARLETIEATPVGGGDGDETFVVTGSYHRRGDSLEFVTEIIDRTRNRTLPPPEPARVSHTDPLAAIQPVSEGVTGALAYYTSIFGVVEAPERTPPSWEAYAAFVGGLRYGVRLENAAAAEAYRRAIEIDPRFTEAYLLLYGNAFFNEQGRTYARGGYSGRFDAMDSLAREMRRSITPLTRFDRAVLDGMDATARGDLKAARAAGFRTREFFAPANFAVGMNGLFGNRPREAVQALESLDPDVGWLRDWSPYWWFLTGALHMLADHDAEARAAARWRERFPQHAVVAPLRAAIGQRRLDGLVNQIENLSGEERLHLALELRAHGHRTQADSALTKWMEWYDRLPVDGQRPGPVYAAIAFALSGRLPEAIAMVATAAQGDTMRLDLRGLLGTLHAQAGNRDVALTISKQLSTVDEPYLHGLVPLWRAKIASQLGERDEAVGLLSRAFAQGTRHNTVFPFRGWFSHIDPAFEPLRNYPPFHELVRPR